jgi:hypothetical protein
MPFILLGHNSRVDQGIDSDILRLVFYTDPHLISTGIRSRIDDYPTNSLNKVALVLNHGKNINGILPDIPSLYQELTLPEDKINRLQIIYSEWRLFYVNKML